MDREWVETNPCHGVSRIEQKDAAIYTWIQTREEITKLLIQCPKGIREIVTLAVGTGCVSTSWFTASGPTSISVAA